MMGMKSSFPKYPDFLFMGAVGTLLVGAAFLTVTTGILNRGFEVWPLAMTAVGVFLVYAAISLRKRSPLFFAGMALAIGGLVLVLMYAAGWTVAQAWPLFMADFGVALACTGIRRTKTPRASFVVPSLLFVLLSGFFSLFSFRLVDIGFKRFIMVWWPLVFVIGAAILFVMYARNRARFARPRGESR